MDLPLIYVIILFLNIFDFSPGKIYYKGGKEKHFGCASQGFPQNNEIIKLYRSSDDLVRTTDSIWCDPSHYF